MIVAQKAVLKKDNLFLVLLRSDNEKAFPGLWDFPGGKLELDEDPIDGIKREVMEETGLTIEVGDVLGIYHRKFEDKDVKFVIYKVESFFGDLSIGWEHSKYAWLSKEDILHLPIMPFMDEFLKKY